MTHKTIGRLLLLIILTSTVSSSRADETNAPAMGVKTNKSGKLTIITIKGITYENCKLLRVEPDGISYSCTRGVVKLPFSELPPEYAARYGYNPQAAGEYAQAVQERQAQFRQDQEEAQQRDLQDRGARLEEIRANPKYTVVCKGGKGNAVGTGIPENGANNGGISSGFETPTSRSAASVDNNSDTSPSQGGGSWEAVVSLDGISVVLGVASSYEGANSILYEKGYAGQGYIRKKQ